MRGPDGPGPGGPEGGPPSRGAEGPSAGEAGVGDDGPGDAPRAARQSDGGGDRGDRAGRGDGDGSARKAAEDAGEGGRKTRKSAEDAGEKASKAAEQAKPGKPDKPDADQARTKEEADKGAKQAKDAAKDADDASKQAKDSAQDQDKSAADTARAEKPERAKQAELTSEKRDRIQTALRDKPDVKHRTDVDIDISIGRRLPRDWDFAPLPLVVIEIVPEYRDYVYVWVEDEYLICDPVTYEVVAVIPAGGGSRAAAYGSGGPGKCSTRIELSADERALILDTVRGREVDVADLEVGWSVPREIQLERFPDSVLAEADELSSCRYFVADDQLAIVDPDEQKVVLLIDKS